MSLRTASLHAISEQHSELFRFLLTVNEKQGMNAILRVAGGWVRDSLLGKTSHDVDVAIEPREASSCVTGADFARAIVAYQQAHGLETRTLSVVKMNPEKSKHLETAQMTILDVPVEFCHLRHDEYGKDSRVPSVRAGTPQEDAYRRDFTVNALFYNLHTRLVEDFTSGLADLEARLLRCPLEPHETFVDDPLRLLRGIRLAGQLGFRLHDSILESVDNQLLKQLERKISRERIGVEWRKMIMGQSPRTCWSLLLDLGLADAVSQELYCQGKPRSGTSSGTAPPPAAAASAAHPSAGERESSLLPDDEETREAILASWRNLGPLFDTFTVPSSAAFQPRLEDRLAVIMAAVAFPALRSTLSDERRERVNAWATQGLKQPNVVASAISRMLDAADIVSQVSVLSLTNLTASLRDVLFDALLCLNDRTVPPNALCAVLAFVLHAQTGSIDGLERVAALLRSDAAMLASATRPLPFRADELPALLGISGKQIGPALIAARRFLAHNPDASREEVLEHLKRLASTK